jgi:hypothetical protein
LIECFECIERIEEPESPSLKSQIVNKVTQWFDPLHAVIVGPGLGRDNLILVQNNQQTTINNQKIKNQHT